MKEQYTVKFCMNGDKEKVAFVTSFDSKRDYELFVDTLPYDFIDANDTTHWVDYGDE